MTHRAITRKSSLQTTPSQPWQGSFPFQVEREALTFHFCFAEIKALPSGRMYAFKGTEIKIQKKVRLRNHERDGEEWTKSLTIIVVICRNGLKTYERVQEENEKELHSP